MNETFMYWYITTQVPTTNSAGLVWAGVRLNAEAGAQYVVSHMSDRNPITDTATVSQDRPYQEVVSQELAPKVKCQSLMWNVDDFSPIHQTFS